MSGLLISVIVITHNSSDFILETLDSIRLQTYEGIELIISDDASTDETVSICTDWLKEHKKRFVGASLLRHPEQGGIAVNCNRGFFASNGD